MFITPGMMKTKNDRQVLLKMPQTKHPQNAPHESFLADLGNSVGEHRLPDVFDSINSPIELDYNFVKMHHDLL
jgi:hypothetical protein